MPYHVKDGSVWKEGQAKWVKDGGVWKEVQDGWIKDSGVWKPYYSSEIAEDFEGYSPGDTASGLLTGGTVVNEAIANKQGSNLMKSQQPESADFSLGTYSYMEFLYAIGAVEYNPYYKGFMSIWNHDTARVCFLQLTNDENADPNEVTVSNYNGLYSLVAYNYTASKSFIRFRVEFDFANQTYDLYMDGQFQQTFNFENTVNQINHLSISTEHNDPDNYPYFYFDDLKVA